MSAAQLAVVSRPVMAELTEIFREVLDDADLLLTEDTTADEVPGWDSMTHVALVVETEVRFGVSFSTAELECLRRVGDLLRLIEAKRRR